jgi:hypothetical protein
MFDPGLHGAVESPTGFPHHQRPQLAGPFGHGVVVTDHGHR